MLAIFFKRILLAIPVLFAVASITFFLIKLAPGGPFDADKVVSPQVMKNLNAAYNLDAPLHQQYFDYMINDSKRNRFNNRLKKISEKYNLPLLNKSIYQCDFNNKRCKIFTPSGDKINYNSHHHTYSGLKYLGSIIHSIDWFKLR